MQCSDLTMNKWNRFRGRTWLMIFWELLMGIYRLLVWMLLTDATDGVDHMIIADDYHGIV